MSAPDASTRVIAVDGPSGSGKSTVARGLADALDLDVLDTGAMYRAVTLAALRARAPLGDEDACAKVARNAQVEVEGGVTKLDGRDVSDEIRGPEVTAAVSFVSAHPAVRKVLVDRQRDWVKRHDGGVVEGRDIGTVVFPAAPVKVFLTASDDERARRRQRDETAAARDVDVDAVREALARRDHLDSSRATSPLRMADDAMEIDTTKRSVGDVVEEIVQRFRSGTKEA
ncbi:MAG: cytidylate kinase [Actinomycetia bacterium]|nr:cytidylate kinase [Actinomycetes bacterium]